MNGRRDEKQIPFHGFGMNNMIFGLIKSFVFEFIVFRNFEFSIISMRHHVPLSRERVKPDRNTTKN